MLIIDRFEGDFAVIEYDDMTFDLPRKLLPKDVKEGDVLRLSISVDKEHTEKRRKRVNSLMNELFD